MNTKKQLSAPFCGLSGLREIEHRGYYISIGLCGPSTVSVQVCGDEMAFDTVDQAKAFIDQMIEKDGLSAPAPALVDGTIYETDISADDQEFIIDQARESFLRDMINDGIGFRSEFITGEMYIGDDGELYSREKLFDDYEIMRKDQEYDQYLKADEISSFQDFMEYQTAMGGFLHEIYEYYGYSVNGVDIGYYADDMEGVFDEIERNTDLMNRITDFMAPETNIEIVRYIVR